MTKTRGKREWNAMVKQALPLFSKLQEWMDSFGGEVESVSIGAMGCLDFAHVSVVVSPELEKTEVCGEVGKICYHVWNKEAM